MATLVERWLRLAAARVRAERVTLSDLDAAIGDGDHGHVLARGFGAIVERFDSGAWAGLAPADQLAAASRTITGIVGGASGALYGRAFCRAAPALAAARAGNPGMADDIARSVAALEWAADAIGALGRSAAGQKTMLAPAAGC